MKHLLDIFSNITAPWWTIAGLILGPSGLLYGLLTWLRYRPKDASEVRLNDANALKIEVEAEKVKADAKKVEADADITVAEGAMKLADLLRKEIDMAKSELRDKDERLDKTQSDLNSVKSSLQSALFKVSELQSELDFERKKNADMSAKNQAMSKKILELETELKKLKK